LPFAVETTDLTKRFTHQRGLLQLFSRGGSGETIAVNRVALQVQPGEIFGLLGPNGAGKTTLIKMLSTLLLPSSGAAYVFGRNVVKEAQYVKSLIGLVASEERSFFWRLTGRQNLQFFAALYNVPGRQANGRIAELLGLLDLSHAADIRFNEYSTGMRQKLAIARGLLNQPKMLFMDEPTKGLDPISAQELLQLIEHKLVGQLGSTVVITTHIFRDIEQICGRIAIMNKGKVAACGTLEELRSLSRRHERYRLRVQGLSEEGLQGLRRVRGVMDCAKLSQDNGVMEFWLHTGRGSNALSEALRQIFQARCEVLCCTLEEDKLEEVFSRLLQSGETSPAF